MNWRCRWFGHRWMFTRNELISDNAGSEYWWWEFFKCPRCGVERREAVASPRG